MAERYHLDLAPQNVNRMEHSLSYQAIDDGAVDLIDIYSTDAKIKKSQLRVLEDDRGLFSGVPGRVGGAKGLRRRASPRVAGAHAAARSDQRAGDARDEQRGGYPKAELCEDRRAIPRIRSAALAEPAKQHPAAHARASLAGRHVAAVFSRCRHPLGRDRRALSRRRAGHFDLERAHSDRAFAGAAVFSDSLARRRHQARLGSAVLVQPAARGA